MAGLKKVQYNEGAQKVKAALRTSNIWKFKNDGTFVRSIGYTSHYDEIGGGFRACNAITVDSEDNTYSCEEERGFIPANVWKFNPLFYFILHTFAGEDYGISPIGHARAIAVDADQNIYVGTERRKEGGEPLDHPSVYKFNPGGSVAWEYNISSDARGIGVDSSGNVYVVGKSTDDVNEWNAWKFNSNGNLLTRASLAGGVTLNALAVDEDGNCHILAPPFFTTNAYKTNNVFGAIWDTELDFFGGDIKLDGSRDVYVVAHDGFDSDCEAWKLSGIDGGIIWNYEPDIAVGHRAIAVDSDKNAFLVGRSQPLSKMVFTKLNTNGVKLWRNIYDGIIDRDFSSVAVDSKDNVIVGGFGGRF